MARKKINVLFLTRKGKGYVGAANTRYEFEQHVRKYARCKFAGQGWRDYKPSESTDLTVGRVMPDADWVIDRDNNLLEKRSPNREYRIGVFLSDLHAKHFYKVNNHMRFAEMINKADYDAVFMRYPLLYGTNYHPKHFWELIKTDKHWVPWSVNEKMFYPREIEKDVIFSGTVHRAYPLRREMWRNFYYVARGYKACRHMAPTGETYERSFDKLRDTHLVGEDYAEALGSSRILLFGCSKYRYPIQKFFEGTASGCLIISNAPGGAKKLGFFNRDTFIDVDERCWEDALLYFLENEDECKKIARSGLEMTLEHHTHDVRAGQWLEMLT